jgi:hypothetical protein
VVRSAPGPAHRAGVRHPFHPNYLSTWLRQRGYTPQKPRRVPREQDDEAIARWLAEDWPRIKQKACRRDACLLLRTCWCQPWFLVFRGRKTS